MPFIQVKADGCHTKGRASEKLCPYCRKWFKLSKQAFCTKKRCLKKKAEQDKKEGKRYLSDMIAEIDSKWARENNGKGHWSHQHQRFFSSRKELREYARANGESIIDGPMGTTVGDYTTGHSPEHRERLIRQERREHLERAVREAERRHGY